MNPDLYKSAQDGNLGNLKQQLDVLVGNNGQLPKQLTMSNSNLLHVLSQFGDFEKCVHGVLDNLNFEFQQLMLTSKNSVNETALHVASRNGRVKIVEALIQRAQALDTDNIESGVKVAEKMMRATDHNGDMALHNAVKMKHEQIVQLLVSFDPDFKYPANKMEETPLYLAVVRGSQYHRIVDILLKCSSLGYEGPNGRTAVHAAIVDSCHECMEKLLKKNLTLSKEADKFGWIPLHLAAYNDHPLLMEGFLEFCPDCWDVVNSKSQNILHLAATRNSMFAFWFILKKTWAINLINHGDEDGNTPLHLLIANCNPFSAFLGIELMKPYQVDPNAVNKEGFTPFDLVEKQGMSLNEKNKIRKQLREMGAKDEGRVVSSEIVEKITGNDMERVFKRASEGLRKFGETQLIVATLVATVTFAAGFTLPGGYDGNEGPNQGMAVLIKKAAFKTFVVSDTIAVVSSLFSVFLHFAAAFNRNFNVDDVDADADADVRTTRKLANLYLSAMVFLVIAKIGMVIAFITGLYTVLDEGSIGLAISVCCLGCIALVSIFYKLHRAVVSLPKLLEYVWVLLLGGWREKGRSVWKLAAKPFVGWHQKLKRKFRQRS